MNKSRLLGASITFVLIILRSQSTYATVDDYHDLPTFLSATANVIGFDDFENAPWTLSNSLPQPLITPIGVQWSTPENLATTNGFPNSGLLSIHANDTADELLDSLVATFILSVDVTAVGGFVATGGTGVDVALHAYDIGNNLLGSVTTQSVTPGVTAYEFIGLTSTTAIDHIIISTTLAAPDTGDFTLDDFILDDFWIAEANTIQPPPIIDETAKVAPDADIGDGSTVGANTVIKKGVTVSEGSNIGTNATIHKDAQFGDSTVIGDGSTVHKDVIAGDDLTLGNNVTIHKDIMIGARVTIGDSTVIHKGTVIGNDVTIGQIGGGVGVFVGKNVTISSGAVILDGDTIPSGTMITP